MLVSIAFFMADLNRLSQWLANDGPQLNFGFSDMFWQTHTQLAIEVAMMINLKN